MDSERILKARELYNHELLHKKLSWSIQEAAIVSGFSEDKIRYFLQHGLRKCMDRILKSSLIKYLNDNEL